MPDLTEKNAINTFLLFSPSLSADLFMFLELCLHCLAFIRGDVGHCSARINAVSRGCHVANSTRESSVSFYYSDEPTVRTFRGKRFFIATFLEETLKAQGRGLQIPEWACALGGSSLCAVYMLQCAGSAQVQIYKWQLCVLA